VIIDREDAEHLGIKFMENGNISNSQKARKSKAVMCEED
jgi:hypothetical protein